MTLAEVVHWPRHRFFYASLFQPQNGALAGQPLHPLIAALPTRHEGVGRTPGAEPAHDVAER